MSEFVVLPEQQIAFVEGLIKANPEIAGLQAYEYLRSNVASQKQLFIENPDSQLDLNYPELEATALRNIAVPTQVALEAMLPVSTEPKAESLFESISARFAEISMLSAAQRMNDKDLSEVERREAEQWFVMANEAIYGKPEPRVFSGLMKEHVISQFKKANSSLPITTRIIDEMRDLIGELPETDYVPFIADDKTVRRINALLSERFNPLIEHIDGEKVYTVPEICKALEDALHKMGGEEYGWSVKVVPNSSALSVSAHQKQVEVGENRAAISGLKLQGRVMHELGIHVGRSINAEKAGWLSAQYGSDGYLEFEEAIATAFEDAYSGDFRESGAIYHLIAGLAYGLDNHETRDLREVYEVMWRYNALKGQKGEIDLSESVIAKAQNSAFTYCMRLFRGTTTQQRGVAYLKDLSYFNGQVSAWRVLDMVTSQADLDIIVAGKLDITRSDHRAIAEEIVVSNTVG